MLPSTQSQRESQDLEAGILGAENSRFSSRQLNPTLAAVGPPANGSYPREEPPSGWWARFKGRCVILWRRCKAEWIVEWPLLKKRWFVVVLCLLFQYVHAVFTTLAYHLHEPLPEPLHDIGFEIFPPLGQSKEGVTEALVYTGFGVFAVWILSPFVTRRKSFHSIVVFKRVLLILVTCQTLRIISFLSTQIPAPNYHCLSSSPDSTLAWPDHWWQNIIVNVSRQASKSCGDLIFSSHTTFLLVFMWTYAVMGKYLILKILTFMYVAATSCLIIASRKHYTVDITVAWYVVPAFFFHFKRRWSTQRNDEASPDGSSILACQALPISPTSESGSAADGSGSGGAKGGLLGGVELLAGKLAGKLGCHKAQPYPMDAQADSQQLLAGHQQGVDRGPAAAAAAAVATAAGGASPHREESGPRGAAAAGGALAGADVEAGSTGRRGPAAAGGGITPSDSSGSGGGLIPAASNNNGSGVPLSEVKRSLSARGPAAGPGLQGMAGHDHSESGHSSTSALMRSADALV